MKKFPLLFCAVFGFLCAIPATSHAFTKSEQVERYLGSYRYKNDRPLGTVKFIFQEAVLKRQGDGKKTYEQLLFNERYFSNRDNAGHLIGIQVVYKGKTKTIRPESPTDPDEVEAPAVLPWAKKSAPRTLPPPLASRSNPKPRVAVYQPEYAPVHASLSSSSMEDAARPRSIQPSTDSKDGGGGGGIHVPDSTEIATGIDNAKEKITGWKGKMWQSVRPIWEFVMWVFSSIIVMLVCFGGILRYVAKTAANESLINSYGRVVVGRWIVSAHQNAAAMLLIITWIIAVIMLIDVFMWLVFLNLPIWTMLVIWFPILWVAEKITSWIVPNIPVIGGR